MYFAFPFAYYSYGRYITVPQQEWITWCDTATTSTTGAFVSNRQEITYYRYFTTAVDYFLLVAHSWILRSYSYVSVLAKSNPAVENASLSVECATTHNMFFMDQEEVVSSGTVCWGSKILFLYEITPPFLLPLFPALGLRVGDLKYFISIITPLLLLRFHVEMLCHFLVLSLVELSVNLLYL